MRWLLVVALLVGCAHPARVDVVKTVVDDHDDIFPVLLVAAKEHYQVEAIDRRRGRFALAPIVLDDAPTALVLVVQVRDRRVGYGGYVQGRTKSAQSLATRHTFTVTPIVYRDKHQLTVDELPPAASEQARNLADYLYGRVLDAPASRKE